MLKKQQQGNKNHLFSQDGIEPTIVAFYSQTIHLISKLKIFLFVVHFYFVSYFANIILLAVLVNMYDPILLNFNLVFLYRLS